MSDGEHPDPYGHALRAIQTLRGWGATTVRIGGIEAVFAPMALLPELPQRELTAAEREQQEERDLYRSAGG